MLRYGQSGPWPWDDPADSRVSFEMQREIGMTVVIMSLLWNAGQSEPRHIFAASDMLLSSDTMSLHMPFGKLRPIAPTWLLGYSGIPAHFPPLTNQIAQAIPTHATSQETVDAAKLAYQQYRARLVSDTLLSPYGMNLDEFRNSGLTVFGPDTFARIRREIAEFDPGITLLLGGWNADTLWDTRLTIIRNPGVIEEQGLLGVAAVGSGAEIALGHLYAVHSQFDAAHQARYRILEAKIMSEQARSVGPDSVVINLNRDGSWEELSRLSTDAFRTAWTTRRRDIEPDVADTLQPTPVLPQNIS